MSNSCSENENSEKMPATIPTSNTVTASASTDPVLSNYAQTHETVTSVSLDAISSNCKVVNGQSDSTSLSSINDGGMPIKQVQKAKTTSSSESHNTNDNTAKWFSNFSASSPSQASAHANSNVVSQDQHHDEIVPNGYALAAGGGSGHSSLDVDLPPLSNLSGTSAPSVSPTITATTNAWLNAPKFVAKNIPTPSTTATVATNTTTTTITNSVRSQTNNHGKRF